MKFQISMRSTDGMTDLTLLLPQEGKGCESTHYASPVFGPCSVCTHARLRVTPSSRHTVITSGGAHAGPSLWHGLYVAPHTSTVFAGMGLRTGYGYPDRRSQEERLPDEVEPHPVCDGLQHRVV